MPTILLVDDTESLRKLAHTVLTRAGFTVVPAADGEEALQLVKARQEPFDLLITDLGMPVIGGRELAARLRQQQPNLRVLFMSGSAETMDMTLMADGSRTWWLSKPFNPDEFLALVQEAIRPTQQD